MDFFDQDLQKSNVIGEGTGRPVLFAVVRKNIPIVPLLLLAPSVVPKLKSRFWPAAVYAAGRPFAPSEQISSRGLPAPPGAFGITAKS
jgi:hypothetical protein